MFLKKTFQGAVLFLGLASLNLAVASSMREWDGSFDDGESSEEVTPRGFVDDTMPVSPENVMPSIEFVDVVVSPRRQNQNRLSHKDLAMVQLPSSAKNDIKDETATTGENAKKHLPLSVGQEITPSAYLHEINQVIPSLLPMDSSLEKDE